MSFRKLFYKDNNEYIAEFRVKQTRLIDVVCSKTGVLVTGYKRLNLLSEKICIQQTEDTTHLLEIRENSLHKLRAFEKQKSSSWVNNELIILSDYINRGDLYCYKMGSMELIWHTLIDADDIDSGLSLDDFGLSPNRYIGTYKNVLYLVLHSGYLIGLDLDTGVLVKSFMLPDVAPASFEDVYMTKNKWAKLFQLDSESGRASVMVYQYYLTIDLNSDYFEVVEIKDQLEEFELDKIRGLRSFQTMDSRYFYFGHIEHSQYKNNVGVFDMETKKVVDAMAVGVFDVVDNEHYDYYHPLVHKMHVTKDKLYIHNEEKKLYVIELEHNV